MAEERIHGARSYVLRNGRVSVVVTREGGHLTADFDLDGRIVRPYARAPWQADEIGGELPVLLTHLRGDFLCLPFGPQKTGPPHGETANGEWLREDSPENELRLGMTTGDTGCRVTKSIEVREGETAIYLCHRIEGLTGDWSYGSHPVLDFSDVAEGQGRVSTSAIRWGSTYPSLFSDPANDESQSLLPNARFEAITSVPMLDGGTADLSQYPAREGFDDLIMLVNEQGDEPFAWTACVLNGYAWFSLKRAEDFPASLFWISNGGRRSEPWRGRHLKRLGLEEVCSHFCDDVEVSRQGLLAKDGIATTRNFDGSTVNLRLIQAVSVVPKEFDEVVAILPGEGGVELKSRSGKAVRVPLDWQFLKGTC